MRRVFTTVPRDRDETKVAGEISFLKSTASMEINGDHCQLSEAAFHGD